MTGVVNGEIENLAMVALRRDLEKNISNFKYLMYFQVTSSTSLPKTETSNIFKILLLIDTCRSLMVGTIGNNEWPVPKIYENHRVGSFLG